MIASVTKKKSFFKQGDRVTAKIPRIYRGNAALTRLTGVIGKDSEHKEIFYTVLTSFGTLQDSYRASDLEPYSGLVSVNINDLYSKMIALHTAANLQAVRTGCVEEVNAVFVSMIKDVVVLKLIKSVHHTAIIKERRFLFFFTLLNTNILRLKKI
jgi:hypothetical protein